MLSRFARLHYSSIDEPRGHGPLRPFGLVCVLLAAAGIGACGGGSGSGSSGGGDGEYAVGLTFQPKGDDAAADSTISVAVEGGVELDPRTVGNDTVTLRGPDGSIPAAVSYASGVILVDPHDSLSPGMHEITVSDGVEVAGAGPIRSRQSTFTVAEDDDGGNEDDDGSSGDPPPDSEPPKLDEWEQDMKVHGREVGDVMVSSDYSTRLNWRYYDGQRVFLQIADYLGEDQPWNRYAQAAEDTYKKYMSDNNGQVAGWERFPHGLYMDYEINGDNQSREYLVHLRDRGPFSYPEGQDGWAQQMRSREIAYSLQSQMVAEKAGYDRQHDRVDTLVDLALGHIEIWTTGNYVTSTPDWRFCQAFWAGLTASALIEYYETSLALHGETDPRVPEAIAEIADWLWQEMWVADVDGTGHGAFRYVKRADGTQSGPARDLNMLIVPMYGWLYQHTGESRYLERGDEIFASGVELGYMNNGKQFNQAYRASFQFLEWRRAGLIRHGG